VGYCPVEALSLQGLSMWLRYLQEMRCGIGVALVTTVGLEFQTRQSSSKTQEAEVTCCPLLQHWALTGLNTAKLCSAEHYGGGSVQFLVLGAGQKEF